MALLASRPHYQQECKAKKTSPLKTAAFTKKLRKPHLSVTASSTMPRFPLHANRAPVSPLANSEAKTSSFSNAHLIASVLEASLSKSWEIHFLMRLSDARQIRDHQVN